jgi:hypothetical protein
LGSLRGTEKSRELDVDRRIILKWIIGKSGCHGLDSSGSGQGPVASSYEHGNEPFGSVRGGQFLD